MTKALDSVMHGVLTRELFERVAALGDCWNRPNRHVLRVLLVRGLRDAEHDLICIDCGCTPFDPCEALDSGPCGWESLDENGFGICTHCAENRG